MKKLFSLLVILPLLSFKPTPTINKFQRESNNAVLKEKHSSHENFSKAYVGTIGKDLRVVFQLSIKNGKINGSYFYQRTGLNITLVGTITDNDLQIFELDTSRNRTALISAKISRNQINGTWQGLETGRILTLKLIQTDKAIPEIPKDLEGNYKNSEETACDFNVKISKKNAGYSYEIKTAERKLSGLLTFYRSLEEQSVYVIFEGIEWAEDLGTLDENNEAIHNHDVLPIGIQGLLEKNKITFQNSGNAMNYYTKFSDCGDKFIVLEKTRAHYAQ